MNTVNYNMDQLDQLERRIKRRTRRIQRCRRLIAAHQQTIETLLMQRQVNLVAIRNS